MSLQCPVCQRTVPAADVNIVADLARCVACGEVFRPSAALGPRPNEPAGEQFPPAPVGPPARTKVRIEDLGGTLLVHLPPIGFSFGLVFLIAFAIAWWSFLSVFIGFGVWGAMESDRQEQSGQMAIEAESAPESEPAVAEKYPSEPGDSNSGGSGLPGWGGVFLCLFMLPFFAAGLAMVLGILWPLFGRTRVRLSTDVCLYRASLLGIGRTHSATLSDTCVRWTEEPIQAGGPWHRASGFADMCGTRAAAHIMLALGSWETSIGQHLSRREQEWVFNEIRTWLKRYAQREPLSLKR